MVDPLFEVNALFGEPRPPVCGSCAMDSNAQLWSWPDLARESPLALLLYPQACCLKSSSSVRDLSKLSARDTGNEKYCCPSRPTYVKIVSTRRDSLSGSPGSPEACSKQVLPAELEAPIQNLRAQNQKTQTPHPHPKFYLNPKPNLKS